MFAYVFRYVLDEIVVVMAGRLEEVSYEVMSLSSSSSSSLEMCRCLLLSDCFSDSARAEKRNDFIFISHLVIFEKCHA